MSMRLKEIHPIFLGFGIFGFKGRFPIFWLKARIGNPSLLPAPSNDCHVLIPSLITQHFNELPSPSHPQIPHFSSSSTSIPPIRAAKREQIWKKMGIFVGSERAGREIRALQEEPFWVGFVDSFLTWGFLFFFFGVWKNQNISVLSSSCAGSTQDRLFLVFFLNFGELGEEGEGKIKLFYFIFGGWGQALGNFSKSLFFLD